MKILPKKKKQEETPIPAVEMKHGVILDREETDSLIQSQLSSCKVAELRAIAKRHKIRLEGTKKANIVEQLCKGLWDCIQRPDILQRLTTEEFQTLRLLYTVYGISGTLLWDEAKDAWKRLNPKGTEENLRDALNGLFTYGFLYPCNEHVRIDTEIHYHWLPTIELLRLPVLKWKAKPHPVPRKRRRSSPRETTPPVPTAIWMLTSFLGRESVYLRTPLKRHPQADQFPWVMKWEHDTKEIDRLIRQGFAYSHGRGTASTPIVTPAHQVAEDVLQKLSRWLGTDDDFADWLVLLAMDQALLRLPEKTGGPLNFKPSVWDNWAALSPDAQLNRLYNSWQYGIVAFTELALVKKLNPNLTVERTILYYDFEPAYLDMALQQARQFVARLLQDLPALQWLDWRAFVDQAYRINAQFMTCNWPFEVWGFREQKGKRRLDPSNHNDWNKAYRPVLAAIFEGPLRWLGAMEITYKEKQLVAFRLTETGAWLLRGEGTPKVAPVRKVGEPPVAWQGKDVFHVYVSPETLDFLKVAGRIATPTNRPYTYRVADKNIEQTFKEGTNPSMIIKAFAEVGAPMPEITRRRLEETWARFGQLHLYENLTVIELTDDMALREILANTNIDDHIIHQFSPRLVVVDDQIVDRLLDTLVKKGYTPKLVEGGR